jgi:mercuric ion transport protein
MDQKSADRIYRAGLIGAAVTALCCFTPALVVLLSLLGFSATVGYLDYVLFPVLGGFLILAAWGWLQRRRCYRKR